MNTSPASPSVAVLGAGLAGLRAARKLVSRGFSVSLLEARERVGGRIGGHWADGHWMDSAWPVLGGHDASIARLAREVGVGDSMWPLRPVQTTLMRDGETVPVDGLSLAGASRIPGPKFIERAKLLRFPRLMSRYARLLDATRPEQAASLDFRSVRDHVALYFGEGNLEFWLTPEIQSTYGDSVEELSRVALLQHCQAAGISGHRPALAGLPRRPFVELLEAAAEGLQLRLGMAVERVNEEPSGGYCVEMMDAGGQHQQESYDAVVVALGPREAAVVCRSLLTPAERDFFAATEERSVATLSVAIEGVDAGLPTEIRVPRRDGSAIASIVVEPGQTAGRVPEGQTQMTVLARDAFAKRWVEMPNDVVAKNLLSSLELAMPGLGDRLKSTLLGRGVVPFFGVGSYRRLANFQSVQTDRRGLGRRLYWAGDYLSGGSFEAASLSGIRSAEALSEDFNQN